MTFAHEQNIALQHGHTPNVHGLRDRLHFEPLESLGLGNDKIAV